MKTLLPCHCISFFSNFIRFLPTHATSPFCLNLCCSRSSPRPPYAIRHLVNKLIPASLPLAMRFSQTTNPIFSLPQASASPYFTAARSESPLPVLFKRQYSSQETRTQSWHLRRTPATVIVSANTSLINQHRFFLWSPPDRTFPFPSPSACHSTFSPLQ